MHHLALVTEENDIEVQLKATAAELCEAASNVVIFTRPDLSRATDLVKAIKDRAKQIEDERTRLVRPFNEGVKQINGRFKAMLTPLQEAEADMKSKMLTFQQEEARKAESERLKREEDQRKREAEDRQRCEEEERKRLAEKTEGEEQDRAPLPQAVVEQQASPPAPVASNFRPTTWGQTGATSTVKKVWTFEPVDISQVPAQYLVIDQVKVNQAIRAGTRDIPGLRIFEKDTISIR